MKAAILAIVAVAEGGEKTPRRKSYFFQPLLGKTPLQLTTALLAGLRPAKIYLATGLDKESIPGHEVFAREDTMAVGGWPQDLSLVFSLRGKLASNAGPDLLILDSRFPLLQAKTLKSVFRWHTERENAMTVLEAGTRMARRKTSPPERKASFSDIAAIFLRGSALAGMLREKATEKRPRLPLAGLCRSLEEIGKKVEVLTLSPDEGLPVDSPARASLAIRVLRLRKIRQLEARGVVVLDPLSTWVDIDVRIGRETVLYPNVVIEGNSRLGRECRVYPFVHIINTRLADRVKVLSSTVLEGSRVEDEAQVGPFTHFRPGTVILPRAKVGNFVEMKNTVFGPRSKAGHLSYLGDCVVKEGVNIGAGTITCNYDGLRKHRTIIESGAFIGSGTELVAPVKVGRNAYIGAGSTITKDVSPDALAVARSKQVERPGWARRKLRQ